MPLKQIPDRSTDDVTWRKRVAENINGVLRFEHDDWRSKTQQEAEAGVTVVNPSYPVLDVRRYGAKGDGSTDDTLAIEAAISVAQQAIDTGIAARVTFPTGVFITSSQIQLPNRVSLQGAGVRGSVIKAHSSHAGPFMFEASNGILSMFNSFLSDLHIDCNDVAGLGGVLSRAWQENSGPRRLLINNFRTYGIKYQDGEGGASYNRIEDCEIFGSALGCTAGIRVDEISAVGAFKLHIIGGVCAGNGAGDMPIGIDMENDSLLVEGTHFEDCDVGVNLDGFGVTTLITCTGSSSDTVTVLQLQSSFSGMLRMISCRRNGATNLLVDNRTGGLGTIQYDMPEIQVAPVSSVQTCAIGAYWSAGIFDGSVASPAAIGFNVSSITKNGTGDYTINEFRARPSTNTAAPEASCNVANAIVTPELVGVSSYRIRIRVGGVLTDSNEVHFKNLLVA